MTNIHLFALGDHLIRNRNFRRLAPLVLVLLAALLRFGYLSTAPRGMQFDHVDAQGYHWIAVNLLERGVFSMNTEAPFREDNIRAPLYPLFVAGWYAIGGPMPEVVVLAQVLVDVLTVAVLFRLGAQVAGRRVGWLAALLYALHPAPWRFCNELLTEILFGLLLTSSVWMFARYLARGRNRDALRCGVLFGAAILCKPNIQFLPLVLVVILLHGVTTGRKQWWQGAALMAGVIALMLAPWMLRNRIIFGEAFYTRTFDDNLAHVSAVATLAEINGEAVAPWTPRWEELYAQVIAQAAQRYGWASVDEATLSSRERDVRLQQITAVSLDLLRAHPKEFILGCVADGGGCTGTRVEGVRAGSGCPGWDDPAAGTAARAAPSGLNPVGGLGYRLRGRDLAVLCGGCPAATAHVSGLHDGNALLRDVRAGTYQPGALPATRAAHDPVAGRGGRAVALSFQICRQAIDKPSILLYNMYMMYSKKETIMERKCSAAEARANFSQLVTEAGYAGQKTIIQRNNRPVAVILGYEEYLTLRQQAEERARRFAVYDEIRERNLEAEPEQVEADVAEALRAARGKE